MHLKIDVVKTKDCFNQSVILNLSSNRPPQIYQENHHLFVIRVLSVPDCRLSLYCVKLPIWHCATCHHKYDINLSLVACLPCRQRSQAHPPNILANLTPKCSPFNLSEGWEQGHCIMMYLWHHSHKCSINVN